MTRRHITPSGRFEVRRDSDSVCIGLRHAVSGLGCGGFSHIAVRTFKDALAGVARAEATMSADRLALIDAIDLGDECGPATREAQKALIAALIAAFPNGAWSPR